MSQDRKQASGRQETERGQPPMVAGFSQKEQRGEPLGIQPAGDMKKGDSCLGPSSEPLTQPRKETMMEITKC